MMMTSGKNYLSGCGAVREEAGTRWISAEDGGGNTCGAVEDGWVSQGRGKLFLLRTQDEWRCGAIVF